MKLKITDSHNNWLECEIDTDAFIDATLDLDDNLNCMLEALAEKLDVGAQDAWTEFLTLIGYKEICGDNTYNHENDLSSTLDWYVAVPEGFTGEWLYSDKTILFVKKHRGGDVRGNYASGKIYRLGGDSETAFLTTVASWGIESGTDEHGAELSDSDLRSLDEKWTAGYTSAPGHAMAEDTVEVLSWDSDSATIKLKSGETVKVSPYWHG